MRLNTFISEPETATDLFMSRYQWLARWAMQFARNDKGAAEELVQDTYLRFSQANLKIEDIRDAEALLYTYLQYVHLAHLREVGRHSFTSLAEAKLDALALGLPNGPDVNRIETQNTLRRIAAYVAWRKQTSKAASIVALRFFHGYLPEEIANIARVSRSAVDERLHKGRSEVRLHLVDAEKLRALQHGGPPRIFPAKFEVPTDELLDELHNHLFYAVHGACVPAQQLQARHRQGADAPLQRDHLAHVVSCRRCLAVVEQSLRSENHPDSSGGNGGVVTMRRRGPRSDRSTLSAREIEDLVRRSRRRQKEIFEHRPTSLIVAVNGEILASRDTGASLSGLKVEVSTRDLKFVEILNEYGLSLLSWAVESVPALRDPVVHRAAEFSMGRRLEVDFQFSAQKLVIEMQYKDPSYREILSPTFAMLDSFSDEEGETEAGAITQRAGAARFAQNVLKRWKNLTLTPSIATASISTMLLAIFSMVWPHRSSRTTPAELLQVAAASEREAAQSAKPGIIFQQVSIRSSGGLLQRAMYRDTEGKHHAKERPLDAKMSRLKMRLSNAGIDWDAPLSASSFNQWQEQNHATTEAVQTGSGQLLRLRADINGSEIGQETITFRADDFHPISKTIEFRDRETVEIAELNYAVVPWATLNHDLFETNERDSGSVIAPSSSRELPQHRVSLSREELIVTELEVRTVLHESHADSTDRLTVSRGSTGIHVSGLIEDEEQRSEVKRRLDLIPHVSSDLASANSTPEQIIAAANPQVVSVVAEPSLLGVFLIKQGARAELSSDVADRLFATSTSLLRANKALSQLKEQFPHDRLPPNALDLYRHLLLSWHDQLEAALRQESEAIHLTGVQIAPDEATRARPVDMDAEIESNRVLLKELIGHDSQNARAAPTVLQELALSVELLREAAAEENQKVSWTTSSNFPHEKDARP